MVVFAFGVLCLLSQAAADCGHPGRRQPTEMVSPVKSIFIENDSVSYKCPDISSILTGPKVRQCSNGSWATPRSLCAPLATEASLITVDNSSVMVTFNATTVGLAVVIELADIKSPFFRDTNVTVNGLVCLSSARALKNCSNVFDATFNCNSDQITLNATQLIEITFATTKNNEIDTDASEIRLVLIYGFVDNNTNYSGEPDRLLQYTLIKVTEDESNRGRAFVRCPRHLHAAVLTCHDGKWLHVTLNCIERTRADEKKSTTLKFVLVAFGLSILAIVAILFHHQICAMWSRNTGMLRSRHVRNSATTVREIISSWRPRILSVASRCESDLSERPNYDDVARNLVFFGEEDTVSNFSNISDFEPPPRRLIASGHSVNPFANARLQFKSGSGPETGGNTYVVT